MPIRVDEFRAADLMRFSTVKGRKKKSRRYLRCVCAFDIESSRLPDIEQSVMYIWQMQIEDTTVIGRTWEEFFGILQDISAQIRGKYWLIIFVHNLSYEFQFLKGLYDFQPDEVFCMDSRKVLKCDMFDCIEFRCSYLLTNMSLAQFLKKMRVPDQKGKDFDYAKIRYPWTELSEEEMLYCINDVRGLVEGLHRMMALDGDSLATLPMTSTGYVRRDMKRAMRSFNWKQLKAMLPGPEVYRLLREAFRGGNTMANRYYADEIVENVSSHDKVSSYPASLLTERYPMTPFKKETSSVAHFRALLGRKNFALLARFEFFNIRLKDRLIGCPYIPKDKCRDLYGFTNANGRILRADHLNITLTDIDFRIILSMYDWDAMKVSDLHSSKYHMLPLAFRNVVMEYYRIKTELKGVPEDSEEFQFYQKNKEKLNATYGMCVEDPARDQMVFRDGHYEREDIPLADLLTRNNRKAFLCYQWGVWCTAWSRKALQDGIDLCGRYSENFVYTDTDSVKSVNGVDFSELNDRLEKKALRAKAYAADSNGEVHFMGVWENEGYELPNRFKTLGAKKYVLEDSEGKLHITIAGVSKRSGAKELGKIENFREGFIFEKAGGTESLFNDDVDMTVTREGREIRITDNVVIRDSTYTLGITQEYRDILDGLIEIKYSDHDIYGLYKVKR